MPKANETVQSKVLVLSANTEYASLTGATLARLFQEGLEKLRKAKGGEHNFDLDADMPGDEDKPLNWLKIRTVLGAEKIDLIVVGCQECTASPLGTALNVLACSSRLGTEDCSEG